MTGRQRSKACICRQCNQAQPYRHVSAMSVPCHSSGTQGVVRESVEGAVFERANSFEAQASGNVPLTCCSPVDARESGSFGSLKKSMPCGRMATVDRRCTAAAGLARAQCCFRGRPLEAFKQPFGACVGLPTRRYALPASASLRRKTRQDRFVSSIVSRQTLFCQRRKTSHL